MNWAETRFGAIVFAAHFRTATEQLEAFYVAWRRPE
jgi:hypothetical protein